MYEVMMFFMIIMFLSLMLFMLGFFLNFKSSVKKEKLSPYECGFEFMTETFSLFSLQFYLMCLIFIIFDLELVLLLTLPLNIYLISIPMISFLFFLVITIGFLYEWYQMSILWF